MAEIMTFVQSLSPQAQVAAVALALLLLLAVRVVSLERR
jgi:hypothetical protein